MNRPLRSLRAAFAALALASPAAASGKKGDTVFKNNDLALLVKTQTYKIPRIKQLIEELGLKPGMKVLDIGAGTGQQSYLIAEKLAGTGKVYSTEIDPMLVDYMAAQARERKLPNLEPVLVSKDGLDPFYGRQRYDLVLLYDVDTYLSDRAGYYSSLKPFLEPGGRVVIVESESNPNRSFYREDVEDFDGLVAAIRAEAPESPFGRQLRAPLQPVLDESGADERQIARRVLFQLNRLLDGRFYQEFSDGLELKGGLDFTPAERDQAAWMLHRLKLDGFPGLVELPDLPLRRFRQLQFLNKLFVIQRYRKFFSTKDLEPYWSRAPESAWYFQHDYRIRELKNAGFELLKKKPLVPFWSVWVFTPAAK